MKYVIFLGFWCIKKRVFCDLKLADVKSVENAILEKIILILKFF
nr:MAG TPA: hypothetical protein [Caudoviricetes sp.]